MDIAILCANDRVGRLVQSALPDVSTKTYGDVSNIEENKILFILYSFSDDVIQFMLQIVKEQGKEIFAIINRQDVKKFGDGLKNQGIPFLVNGVETDEKLYTFLGKPKKLKKSFVFISPTGGSGKSLLSSYVAKKASRDYRVRLVDWNYETPSYYYYFNLPSSNECIVKGLKLLRNDLPFNLEDYDYHVDKNLTVSPMYVDYLESTKWDAKEFAYLWDQYENANHDVVIYEVPNHPFSVTSSVALMRATDVVIPLVAEQKAIANSIALLKWIKTHREIDMPTIHFVLNRYDEETSMGVSQIEKTLEQKVTSVIPEIPDASCLFISGELMKVKLPKPLVEKLESLNTFVDGLGLPPKGEETEKGEAGFLSKIFKK